MTLPLTGSQTVGPFFAIGLDDLCSQQVALPSERETVVIEGRLLDGAGQPIPDGVLEIWQADTHGQYATGRPAASPSGATGFARISTAPNGHFRFTTTKPGPVPYDADRMQAPHLLVLVFMRGLLRNLVTRLYFPDEPANLTDPILQLVPRDRRATLIAQIAQPGSEQTTLHWDIVMRKGEAATQEETVFFAW